MLTGWLRYHAYFILVFGYVYSNYIENCTVSTCDDRGNLSDGQLRSRIKRAVPASCTASASDVAHTLMGGVCCDATIPVLIDNRLSTHDGIGAITRAVQQRVQSLYNRSFEVIISEMDFVINTYYSGSRQCKFETDRYYVALYETPVQYDISDITTEVRLASVDSRDPLGWKQSPLSEDVQDVIIPEAAGDKSSPTEVAPTPTLSTGSAAGASETGMRPFEARPVAVAPEGQSDVCARKTHNPSGDIPYTFSANECCDSRLSDIMRDAAANSIAADQLGDRAKYIQRRIQLDYQLSFEVILSKGDFATSTYYHGMSICKINEGGYSILAYKSPNQYNPFDTLQEDLYASIDSEEPLGSTRPENLRGDLPDIRVDPFAGEDLGEQPAPSDARTLAFAGAGGSGATSKRVEEPSASDMFMDEQQLLNASIINGFHVGGSRTLGTIVDRDSQVFPPGSNCDGDRGGDLCCNSMLYETMTDAFYELSSSPEFNFDKAGNIASLIQKRVQNRFRESYEIIVTSANFASASSGIGDEICKYHERGFAVMAYSTPVQYDITQTENEEHLSSISALEKLGATEPSLPGQRPFHTPLRVYTEGDRAGLPVGSHCSDERAGSKCCSVPLLEAMQSSYNSLVNRPNFDPYNTRQIARTIQYEAEEQLQMSFEIMVSTDDFAIASAYSGNDVCKFRMDRYYIMAYASPVQYPIHTDFYEDSGPAIPLGCPAELTVSTASACCDGAIQYEMYKAIDEASQTQPTGQIDRESLSKTLLRNVERRFNTTFESVVAKTDFVWRTRIYNVNTCRIARDGFHALLYESSKEPPPLSDFSDVPPSVPAEAPPPAPAPQAPAPVAPPQGPIVPPPAPVAPPPAPIAPPPAPIAPPPAPFGPPQAPFAPPQAPLAPPPSPLAPLTILIPEPVLPPFAGAGGGGGTCFSTDTWVTTPNGKKRMDQLKVGDFVLTANETVAYFTPMMLWIHREPNVVTKFVTIMTDYGKMLALTARHLIFRNKCDEYYVDRVEMLPPNSQAVYAEELKVGDCVFLLYKNGFRQQKLQDISITSRKGIFAPLTPNGRIIVNDMLASCFSDLKEPTLQTTYFSIVASLRQRLLSLFGSWIDHSVDIPFGSRLSMEILRLIVPYIR